MKLKEGLQSIPRTAMQLYLEILLLVKLFLVKLFLVKLFLVKLKHCNATFLRRRFCKAKLEMQLHLEILFLEGRALQCNSYRRRAYNAMQLDLEILFLVRLFGETKGGLVMNPKDCNTTAPRDTFLLKGGPCNATLL